MEGTSELSPVRGKQSISEVNFMETTKMSVASTSAPLFGTFKEEHTNIPEAVDDFIRNFLQKIGLSRTLDCFEVEWYSSAQKLLTEPLLTAPPPPGALVIPDALTHKQLLQSELQKVYTETNHFKEEVLSAGDSLVRLQRDRDLHRLHCQKLVADKSRLMEDIKRLKKRLAAYEPALRQLDDKYEAALRQKMLLGLESERIQNNLNAGLVGHPYEIPRLPESARLSLLAKLCESELSTSSAFWISDSSRWSDIRSTERGVSTDGGAVKRHHIIFYDLPLTRDSEKSELFLSEASKDICSANWILRSFRHCWVSP
uniref:Uncharacterized protein n=1 Tax=Hippocampus comes TaxID=109280 RepID=A0A3Q3E436_HIPCM